MALNIDPVSVHLGKDLAKPQASADNLYYADYTHTPAPDPTNRCVLPDPVDYIPGNSTLLSLQPSCAFNFTDVLGIPPPPPPPNPLIYRACETLTASSKVLTTEATKNSSLAIVTGGPITDDTTGTSDCTIQLVGILDVLACTDFAAKSSVTFGNAASTSNLAVIPASAPHCGFELVGNIDIKVCEDFTSSVNVKLGGALDGSYLRSSVTGAPDCGFALEGNLNVKACETLEATADINIHGTGVQKNDWSIEAAQAPNCGFVLTGDVLIDACPTVSAAGTINFLGKAVKTQSVAVTADDTKCGFTLSGDVEIDACASFEGYSFLEITGNAVSIPIPVEIVYTSTPDCGFSLYGKLEINACTSASVMVEATSSAITLYKNVPTGGYITDGEIVDSQPISLSGVVSAFSDGCGSSIALSMSSIDLEVPCCFPKVVCKTLDVLSGSCFNMSRDGPCLYYDEVDDALFLTGALPQPCFTCDENLVRDDGFVYADINIKRLQVDEIISSGCCASTTQNIINPCDGSISFNTPTGDVTQLQMTSSDVLLTSGIGTATSITASVVRITAAEKYTQLEPGGLLLGGLNSGVYSGKYMNATETVLTYGDVNDGSRLDITANFGMTIQNGEGKYSYMNSYELGIETVKASYIEAAYIYATDTLTAENIIINSNISCTSVTVLSGGTISTAGEVSCGSISTGDVGCGTVYADKDINALNSTVNAAQLYITQDSGVTSTTFTPGQIAYKTVKGTFTIDFGTGPVSKTASFQKLTVCISATTLETKEIWVLMAV